MAKQDKGQSGETDNGLENGFDAKAMLLDNGSKERKIRYNDRVKLIIVQPTKFYEEGQIITPHRVNAEVLIANGTAKEYKEKDQK